MEPMLPIGRFARRAGLTVGALRHYHEHGVLEPARIDPVTGYRSYAVGQLEDARLIANLRALNLGLPEVREVLAPIPARDDGGWASTAAGSWRSWREPSDRSIG